MPGGERIRLFAREVRAADLVDEDQPYLVFLQGGPGGRSPRPGADAPGWLAWALRRYRVILLDQRGTGLSTPQDRADARGPYPGGSRPTGSRCSAPTPSSRDAEALRRHLLGDGPWTALGQSFGGFCVWTYLSFAPEGLPGGLRHRRRPAGRRPPRRRLPGDPARRWSGAPRAGRGPPARPAPCSPTSPGTCSAGPRSGCRRASGSRSAGCRRSGTCSARPAAPTSSRGWPRTRGPCRARSSPTPFLAEVAAQVSYATAPLYAVLHEACYGDLGRRHRVVVGPGARRGGPAARTASTAGLPLTGENVYRDSVRCDPALAPLAEAADLLAERRWERPLYDPSGCAANTVPVAACVYARDMYVDPDLSRATAAATGGVIVVDGRGPPPRRPAAGRARRSSAGWSRRSPRPRPTPWPPVRPEPGGGDE